MLHIVEKLFKLMIPLFPKPQGGKAKISLCTNFLKCGSGILEVAALQVQLCHLWACSHLEGSFHTQGCRQHPGPPQNLWSSPTQTASTPRLFTSGTDWLSIGPFKSQGHCVLKSSVGPALHLACTRRHFYHTVLKPEN